MGMPRGGPVASTQASITSSQAEASQRSGPGKSRIARPMAICAGAHRGEDAEPVPPVAPDIGCGNPRGLASATLGPPNAARSAQR